MALRRVRWVAGLRRRDPFRSRGKGPVRRGRPPVPGLGKFLQEGGHPGRNSAEGRGELREERQWRKRRSTRRLDFQTQFGWRIVHPVNKSMARRAQYPYLFRPFAILRTPVSSIALESRLM